MLRDLERVESFKVVGRGFTDNEVIPFIELARRVIDRDFRSRKAVRRMVLTDPRVKCSPPRCYYPVRRNVRVVGGAPKRLRFRKPEPPSWSKPDHELYFLLPPGHMEVPEGVRGVYVGHETCVHMLPDRSFASECWSSILAKGLQIGLILPPLYGNREANIGRDLVETLASVSSSTCEVTINDLGTLYDIASVFKDRVSIAIGRNLATGRNDPRLCRLKEAGADLLSDYQVSHISQAAKLGPVTRVEISEPITWPVWKQELPQHITVHAGPALLATGRACNFLADLLEARFKGRMYYIPERCSRHCLGQQKDLHLASGEVFFAIENAIYTGTNPMGSVPTQVDRVILHAVVSRD